MIRLLGDFEVKDVSLLRSVIQQLRWVCLEGDDIDRNVEECIDVQNLEENSKEIFGLVETDQECRYYKQIKRGQAAPPLFLKRKV